jgi:hypothetical protein
VVPHQQVPATTLVAIDEGRLYGVIGECGDQRLSFFLIYALDPNAVVAHNVQAFAAGIGMGPDDRMPHRRIAVDLRLGERAGTLAATEIEDRMAAIDPVPDRCGQCVQAAAAPANSVSPNGRP